MPIGDNFEVIAPLAGSSVSCWWRADKYPSPMPAAMHDTKMASDTGVIGAGWMNAKAAKTLNMTGRIHNRLGFSGRPRLAFRMRHNTSAMMRTGNR